MALQMVEPQPDLIERLIAALRPVTPLNPLRLLLLSLAIIGLALAVILGLYGVRPDLLHAPSDSPGLPSAAVVKPLMWMWVGLSALHVVMSLSRPEGQVYWGDLAPLPVIMLAQISSISLAIGRNGWETVVAPGFGQAGLCATTILAGAVLSMRLADAAWLRFTASSRPLLLRLMTTLAFATFVAATYALHCPMDQPYYTLGVYIPAIATTVLIELMQWRATL